MLLNKEFGEYKVYLRYMLKVLTFLACLNYHPYLYSYGTPSRDARTLRPSLIRPRGTEFGRGVVQILSQCPYGVQSRPKNVR